MNKGLKALKRIKDGNGISYGDLMKCFDTIENELKALEIIKETLSISLYETTDDNMLGETHYYIDIANCCSYLISKEKYDLLKEALQ